MSDSIIKKRLYVGGLGENVSEDELKERFGRFVTVSNLTLKTRTDNEGIHIKSFAHLDIRGTEESIKKCFCAYQNAKWKGSVMKLQEAKENFLDRLEAEREESKKKSEEPVETEKSEVGAWKAPEFSKLNRAAVPGTPVPGKKDWVVGKYGRVLPILNVKKSYKTKVVKHDPSKFCHASKVFKDTPDDLSSVHCNTLTWDMDTPDSEITKKRKGEFPQSSSKPKKAKPFPAALLKDMENNLIKLSSSNSHQKSHDDDMEIVKVGQKSIGSLITSAPSRFDSDYESDNEDGTHGGKKDNSIGVPFNAKNSVVGSGKTLKKGEKVANSTQKTPVENKVKLKGSGNDVTSSSGVVKTAVSSISKCDDKPCSKNSLVKKTKQKAESVDSSDDDEESSDNGDEEEESSDADDEEESDEQSPVQTKVKSKGGEKAVTKSPDSGKRDNNTSLKKTLAKSKANISHSPAKRSEQKSESSDSSDAEESSDDNEGKESDDENDDDSSEDEEENMDTDPVASISTDNKRLTSPVKLNSKNSKSSKVEAVSHNPSSSNHSPEKSDDSKQESTKLDTKTKKQNVRKPFQMVNVDMSEFVAEEPDVSSNSRGQKRDFQDFSDSDLDSNDFELVAKKLAQRAAWKEKASAEKAVSVQNKLLSLAGRVSDCDKKSSSGNKSSADKRLLPSATAPSDTKAKTSSTKLSPIQTKLPGGDSDSKDKLSVKKSSGVQSRLLSIAGGHGTNEMQAKVTTENTNSSNDKMSARTATKSATKPNKSHQSNSMSEFAAVESDNSSDSDASSNQVRNDDSYDSDLDSNDFELVAKKLALKAAGKSTKSLSKIETRQNTPKEDKDTPKLSGVSRPSGNELTATKTKTSPSDQSSTPTVPTSKQEADNDKRLQAVKEQMQMRQRKQAWMRTALKNVDTASSKRIVFSSSDDDDDGSGDKHKDGNKQKDIRPGDGMGKASLVGEEKKTKPSGMVLLGHSSDDDDDDLEDMFKSKPQFEGKKGEKLMKMQKQFGDSRFKLDAKFVDSDDSDDEDDEEDKKTTELTSPKPDQEESLAEERKRNLHVLESVVGKNKVDRLTAKLKRDTINIVDMNKLRFDPTKVKAAQEVKDKSPRKPATKQDEDSLPEGAATTKTSKKEKKAKKDSPEEDATPSQEVTKSKVTLSDSLVDMLKPKAKGHEEKEEGKAEKESSFSLLDMFDGTRSDGEEEEEMEVQSPQKPLMGLLSPGLKKGKEGGNKKDDSKKQMTESDSDEDMEVEIEVPKKNSLQAKKFMNLREDDSPKPDDASSEDDDDNGDEDDDETDKTSKSDSIQTSVDPAQERGKALKDAGRVDVRFTKEEWLERFSEIRHDMLLMCKKRYKDARKRKRVEDEHSRKKAVLKKVGKGGWWKKK